MSGWLATGYGILFYGADVTVRSLRTSDAALVEVVDWGRCTGGVDPCVDRCAAWAERHRLGGAAVVLQGAEQGSALMPGQVVSG